MDNDTAVCDHCTLPVPRSRKGDDFCCFGCRIAYNLASHNAQGNTLALRLGLGLFLTMNLMVFNWLLTWRHVFHNAGAEAEYQPLASLVSYGLLFLGTLILVTLGVPLAADVMTRTRRGINADMLILLGVVAAYVLSAVNTFRGDDHLYFDTAAIILVLVTLGRYLEARTRAAATADADRLLETLPLEIHAVGDVVTVAAGMTIPVDGVVVKGAAQVDQATLTGESMPRAVEVHDAVMAGSISLDGMLQVRATAVGAGRAIARMQQMLEQARQRQPRIALLADRVARVFVPGVVGLALVVFAWHAWQGDPSRGLFDALSVLLISCPCALGLATPLATFASLGRAARQGILIESGQTLEYAAAVRTVCFDKTGTLTQRAMVLREMQPDDDALLGIAASIEQGATHPIAQALIDAATKRGLTLAEPSSVMTLPGKGLCAVVDGESYELSRDTLRRDGKVIARLTFDEMLRPDAVQAVAQLRAMGVEVVMLTGDGDLAASAVAARLDMGYQAQLLPHEKVRQLEMIRGAGPVAMVGDGINDAPVLAAADVSMAMGTASDLARQACDIHLTHDHLTATATTLRIARHTMWRIRLNLLWAFGYNSLGLVLAATGRLNPVVAALAMLGSSLMIVITSRGAGDVDPVA